MSLPYDNFIVGMLYVSPVELSFGLGDRFWAIYKSLCKAYLLGSLSQLLAVTGARISRQARSLPARWHRRIGHRIHTLARSAQGC